LGYVDANREALGAHIAAAGGVRAVIDAVRAGMAREEGTS